MGSQATLKSTSPEYKDQLLHIKEIYKPKVSFECIGGDTTGIILNALAEDGMLYHYGNLSLRNCSNISTGDLIFMNKKILGFWLFKYLEEHPNVIPEFLKLLEKEQEIFSTLIQGVYRPDNFEAGLKAYRSDMGKGKVLFDFTI